MLLEYVLNLKAENIFEFFIQLILFYNLVQIIKQNNFYYLLSYFLLFIFYIGIYLILFDMDISCIILWILYGGVIIVFFLYSLMWFDNIKNFNYFSKYRIFYYCIGFIFANLNLIFFSNQTITINSIGYKTFYDFYDFLNLDLFEELENLGWGLVYYSTFFFIILSYMLFLACCVSVTIIINAKKIKYLYINLYYSIIKKNRNVFPFSFFKYQYFYSQDYENINQNYSYTKNFKVTAKFHKIKNFNRRV